MINLYFLTRHNAKIKVAIVKLNVHRYSLYKPTIECFNDNINEINRINSIPPKIYKITDEIREELCLYPEYAI